MFSLFISTQFTAAELYALEAWMSTCSSLSITSTQEDISHEYFYSLLALHVCLFEKIQLIHMPHHTPSKSAAILPLTALFSVLSAFFFWAHFPFLEKDTDQFIWLAEVFVCLTLPCRYLASWE